MRAVGHFDCGARFFAIHLFLAACAARQRYSKGKTKQHTVCVLCSRPPMGARKTDVSFWHIGSFRHAALLRRLSDPKQTQPKHASAIYEFTPWEGKRSVPIKPYKPLPGRRQPVKAASREAVARNAPALRGWRWSCLLGFKQARLALRSQPQPSRPCE